MKPLLTVSFIVLYILMHLKDKGSDPELVINLASRSPLWLDIATAGSIAVGLAEILVGVRADSNVLLLIP